MKQKIQVELTIKVHVDIEVNPTHVIGFVNDMAERIAVSRVNVSFNNADPSTEDAACAEFTDMIEEIEGEFKPDQVDAIEYNWDHAEIHNVNFMAEAVKSTLRQKDVKEIKK